MWFPTWLQRSLQTPPQTPPQTHLQRPRKQPRSLRIAAAAAMGLALLSGPAADAKVTAEEAAALGKTLTPIGAEKAGNADGTIPPWTGGLPKAAMNRGDNPYAADKPLYTITADNYKHYAQYLAEGYKALFRTYPDFRMNVYPSHRSAAYPQWFYDATEANATKVELTDSGYGFCCTAQGYPFPIPKNGAEVMWNHIMRYNTKGFRGYVDSAMVAPDGGATIGSAYIELSFVYNDPATTVKDLDNQLLYSMLKTLAPPKDAGSSVLLHVPIDRIKEPARVWTYSPGIGRVRRISEVGYDNPLFDGLMTQDQVDMFNGPLDRYDIKLVGKAEMLVPYNNYALYSPKLKYRQLLKPGHLNPDYTRYELHRVWVIDATVKPKYHHIYKRRRFYLDEDSWLVLMEDIYDQRDQFWRFSEAYAVSFAEVPVVVNGVQVHYDLQSRRYVVLNLTNEESQQIEYDWHKDPSYFTPQQLQRLATSGR
jgi:hypothetical protein